MNTRKAIALVLYLSAGLASAAEPPKSICWPLHYAGITVGVTTDSQMTRLVGSGVFRKDEGDTGGRLVTDTSGSATLHGEFFTDTVVGTLVLSRGVDPSLSASERKLAVSKDFDPREGFGNWHALHLGSTKAEVRANLGNPSPGNDPNVWTYPSACSCEIQDYLSITFIEDKVAEVSFVAPSG